jgi:RNA polymerase sigma-70 factor, ECF subfamily
LNTRNHLSVEEINQELVWIQAAAKDAAQFHKLYDRYFERIFKFIFRRTDNEELTADLTSQTFLKALQNIKKYKPQGVPFSAWLYRIASNEVNDFYRKSKRKVIFSLEESMLSHMFEEEPEEMDNIKIELLTKFLAELELEEMMVLELRFYEEKSFKEMGFILDISEANAKMRTYRTIGKLQKCFSTRKIKEL